MIFRILFGALVFIGFFSCNPNSNKDQSYQNEESLDLLKFKAESTSSHQKNIVLVSGDEEYRSEEVLPQLAAMLSKNHGFNCTVLFAQDPSQPGIVDPNYTQNIPGMEHLESADLMILFTRFRDLPDEQMEHIENYLQTGKPVLAIRTATHAFNVKDTTSRWYQWGNFHQDSDSPWHEGFGRLVLGERWYTHHGHHKHQSTRGVIADGASDHPLTNGIEDGEIWGPTDVYGVRLPLPGDSKPIFLGQVVNRVDTFNENDLFFGMQPSDTELAKSNPASRTNYDPNDPLMPIAWTKSYQLPEGEKGVAFTSTIGSSTDFLNEGVRRLMINASYYLMDLTVPDKVDADIVGKFNPSPYSFHTDEYWEEKNLVISELRPK